MFDTIAKIGDALPVLHCKKRPVLAALIGFLAGGLGLSIYFRSLIDLMLPLAIIFMITLKYGDHGILMGAIFASLYGFFRALSSNQRLATFEKEHRMAHREPELGDPGR